jgi:hypothetical protein
VSAIGGLIWAGPKAWALKLDEFFKKKVFCSSIGAKKKKSKVEMRDERE